MVTSMEHQGNHNWATKGPQYLALPRAAKQETIWHQVTADSQSGQWHSGRHFEVEPRAAFDEQGDEFDCRVKTFHCVGNTAKCTWVSLGDHQYTGMFKGGDSGFIRLSSTATPDNQTQHMSPGFGLKLLRDGIDSGNILTQYSLDGQNSLNFFENSLSNNIEPSVAPAILEGLSHFATETDFPWSMGLSDFASYTQDGVQEEQPVFPWKLRFEPATQYVNPIEDPSTFDLQETLKQLPAGQTLYRVFALDKPTQLGGTESLIGEIKMDTQLVTSQWADEHMFFKHQRKDDDMRQHPEWQPFAPTLMAGMVSRIRAAVSGKVPMCPYASLMMKGAGKTQQQVENKPSVCPFAAIFKRA